MEREEDPLQNARSLSVTELARSIKTIGFECTDCGECCRSEPGDDHVATVFPDEIRSLQSEGEAWDDVAKPMPFGLTQERDETFEWALQSDDCGSCVFFDEARDDGGCTRYADRPVICQTYPFSVMVEGSESGSDVVEQEGEVVAHECEGLGSDITWEDAVALAESLKRRAIKEAKEELDVIADYRETESPVSGPVVYDSEGVKRPDGSLVEGRKTDNNGDVDGTRY